MSRRARINKQTRRNLADPDAYMARYMKRYEWAGRKVSSDEHMQHLWIKEFRDRLTKKDRKPAPFHNGRKP